MPSKPKGKVTEGVSLRVGGEDAYLPDRPPQTYLIDLKGLEEAGGIPAKVSVSGGLTKSIPYQQYNFIRCDVSIEVPAVPTKEGIDIGYEIAKEFVSERIEELLSEALQASESARTELSND